MKRNVKRQYLNTERQYLNAERLYLNDVMSIFECHVNVKLTLH